MALIRNFNRSRLRERFSVHDEIEAEYISFERDGRFFIQIDTYGRTTRQLRGKLSQSIQLDRDGAAALYQIFKREFYFD